MASLNANFENYFKSRASLLGEVLYYHLTLEALLTEFIRKADNAPSEKNLEKMGFSKKAHACQEMDLLDSKLLLAIKVLNRIRNKYAHELNYEISFEEALSIAKQCGDAGVEFTDGVDGSTTTEAKAMGYDTGSLLNETFRNTFFEIAWRQGDQISIDYVG